MQNLMISEYTPIAVTAAPALMSDTINRKRITQLLGQLVVVRRNVSYETQ